MTGNSNHHALQVGPSNTLASTYNTTDFSADHTICSEPWPLPILCNNSGGFWRY